MNRRAACLAVWALLAVPVAWAGDADTIRALQEKAASLKSLRCMETVVRRDVSGDRKLPPRKRQIAWRFPDHVRAVDVDTLPGNTYIQAGAEMWLVERPAMSVSFVDIGKVLKAVGPGAVEMLGNQSRIGLFSLLEMDPEASRVAEVTQAAGVKLYVLEGKSHPIKHPYMMSVSRMTLHLTVGEDGVPRKAVMTLPEYKVIETTTEKIELNVALPDDLFAPPKADRVEDQTDQVLGMLRRWQGMATAIAERFKTDPRPPMLRKLLSPKTAAE